MNRLPFFTDFLREVENLLQIPQVQKMRLYIQHGDTDCLLHCLCVSYLCYRICRFLHLHAGEMARAALLHDLFLYDWHAPSHPRWHGFRHPGRALYEAERITSLTKREISIIKRHMWPLTLIPPRYVESYVIILVDKCCSLRETFRRPGQSAQLLRTWDPIRKTDGS